ncbi:MAG: alpha/beta hydrolase [Propionicimonas sp.]|uniref:alpha/beta hydrolase fold domain-containing protein n=1 Tax=Propionicimonas sp. TaxID=1955623 RepID=UPI003D1375EE
MTGTPTHHFIQPAPCEPGDFPESLRETEGMVVLDVAAAAVLPEAVLSVPFAEKQGTTLHLHLLLPPAAREGAAWTFPLVVYVQGSAWRTQNLGQNLPALARVAAWGYVVAIVEYRPSDVAPFPAQVRDVRTALAFLYEHAAEFRIERDACVLWGDSSGGHTAMLTALTVGDPGYADEPADAPAPVVRGVVDFFGPTDISRMNEEPSTQDHRAPDSPEGRLIGGHDVLSRPDLVAPTIVMNHIDMRPLPPFLVFHGGRDRFVPFGQSVLLARALRDAGHEVSFYKLAGADHGGPEFWSPPVLSIVRSFLGARLNGAGT